MNFLTSGRITRQNCVKWWPISCCRDVIKSTSGNTIKKLGPCKVTTGLSVCKDNLCLAPGALFWTQVRGSKDHPRFHNDIEFPNFNDYRKGEFADVRKTKWGSGDDKPGSTYTIAFLGMLGAAYSAKSIATHYIMYMSAAADVLAMASIEVSLTKIAPGTTASFKWRGKPLFIKHRTQADIDLEYNTPMSALKDPESPEKRCMVPEWLIVIGICTHLGCVPVPDSGDWAGGFYCPCHGSHYDNLGRARKGPAPLNLEVPPYKFLSDDLVLVG